MRTNLVIKSLAAAATLALPISSAFAAPIVDGVIDGSEGYVLAKTYTGANTVSTYFTFDDDYVYGAVKLDSGAASPFPGSNVYFYGTGTGSTYGDGNDIVAEGSNGWGFGSPSGVLPNDGSYPLASPTSNQYAYNAATVNYAYVPVGTNEAGSVVEFSIARSLIGEYDVYRYGGQLFSYEFHTGSSDPSPGALVSLVPEPATLGVLAFASLGLLKRRRKMLDTAVTTR